MSTIVSPQRKRYRAKLQRPDPQVVACPNSSQVRRMIYMAMSPGRSMPNRGLVKRGAAIGIAVALVALCGTLALTLPASPKPAVSTKPVFVQTVHLLRQEACTTAEELPGIIAPTKRSEMGFTRAGRVKRVLVEEGDCVEAGALLAELDSSAMQAELVVAKTELKLAEQRLRALQLNQPAVASIKRGRLYVNESISENQETLASARASLEHWSSVTQHLELMLKEGQLRAPYKAFVAKTYLSDGSVVTADRPVVKIVSHDDLAVRVEVPSTLVEHLVTASSFVFTVGNRQLLGTLKAIAPDFDVAQTREALFVVPDLSSTAMGLPVTVRVDVPTGVTGFRVPKTAAFTAKDGTTTVTVLYSEKDPAGKSKPKTFARQQRVEVLQISSDSLIVRGDLHVNDRIVAKSPDKISNGQRVWFSDRLQWLSGTDQGE